ERALDHRVRADHHPRLASWRGLEPAGAAAHGEPALDRRADPDGDVAVAGPHAAADLRLHQADGAVHRFHVMRDHAAMPGEHAAVDGADAVADLHLAFQPDGAIDRLQFAHLGPGPDLDAAIDRAGFPGAGVLADDDAAIDRPELAVRRACGNLDTAVDLADVLGGPRRRSGQQQGQGDGGNAVSGHGRPPVRLYAAWDHAGLQSAPV